MEPKESSLLRPNMARDLDTLELQLRRAVLTGSQEGVGGFRAAYVSALTTHATLLTAPQTS